MTHTSDIVNYLRLNTPRDYDAKQIADALGMNPHSASARLSELKAHGGIVHVTSGPNGDRYSLLPGADLPTTPVRKQRRRAKTPAQSFADSLDAWKQGYREGFSDGLRAGDSA